MILQLFDAPSSTYTYIVADEVSRDAAIIDPVLAHADRDLAELARHGLNLRWILDTHVHADHETGANALKTTLGAATAVGAACGSVGHDRALSEGDVLPLGSRAIRIIATPGHTPGSLTYHWERNIFTGDSLLIEGCGRTDFQNGSSDQLYDSVTRKLFSLPDDTVVWPGHDYRFRGSSTIGHEKRHNPRFAGKDCAAFGDLMASLKLAPPKLIDHAVPANRHGGALQSGETVPAMMMANELATAFDAICDALVDLRDEAEFAVDAVAAAMRVDAADTELLASIAKRHRTLFLLCRSGKRSLLAADALRKRGHENVVNVTGGMLALQRMSSEDLEAQSHD